MSPLKNTGLSDLPGDSCDSVPNALIWGFAKEFSPIIFKAQALGVFSATEWIGPDTHCTISRKDFMMSDLTFKHQARLRCPEAIYKQVHAQFYGYLDMVYRWNMDNRYDIYDYLNLFNRQLDFYYELLYTRQIDWVIFDRLPHFGADRILYELAVAMGLNTLLFFVSIFPGHSFCIYRVEDFGHFEAIPQLSVRSALTIPQKHEKELPYLCTITNTKYTVARTVREFLTTQNPRIFVKYFKYKRYLYWLSQFSTRSFDTSQPFIYFALHYQPEATTATIGGMFTDQLLAVERLAACLPVGWHIAVKENPYQSEYMRGHVFFDRLRAIANTTLIARDVNTYYLTKHAKFVATITGTVGWEAITGGKPVLIFGSAWYAGFPGVYQFEEGLDCNAIAATTIDHHALEAAYSDRMTKTVPGEISREMYAVITLDVEKNAETVADSLKTMIDYKTMIDHKTRPPKTLSPALESVV
ncbi:MAG: hypothetical protein AAGI66_07910 [Cyanobacteria bacterium P01_H01_bin.74]